MVPEYSAWCLVLLRSPLLMPTVLMLCLLASVEPGLMKPMVLLWADWDHLGHLLVAGATMSKVPQFHLLVVASRLCPTVHESLGLLAPLVGLSTAVGVWWLLLGF